MTQKTVLISGGSRGLGADLVAYYLDKGYSVATFSRSKTDFIDSIENNTQLRDRFCWCKASLGDISSLKKALREFIQKFTSIDILINNAAIMKEGILISMQDDDIEDVIDTNLLGMMQLTKLCLKAMTVAGAGNIVFISSIVGQVGINGLSVYTLTKSAIPGLVRALTREYSARNIRINAIAPGFLDTEMTINMDEKRRERIVRKTPLGRLGRASDIVKVVGFLTSDEADFITGQTITVDGGYTA